VAASGAGSLVERFAPEQAAEVTDYGALGASVSALASLCDGAEMTWLCFEAGGALGEHEAGRDQLLVVVDGAGWLDVEGARVELARGDVGVIRAGQRHAKGSDVGMTALVLQAPSITIA